MREPPVQSLLTHQRRRLVEGNEASWTLDLEGTQAFKTHATTITYSLATKTIKSFQLMRVPSTPRADPPSSARFQPSSATPVITVNLPPGHS
jgi:hypothetical protein